MTDKLKLRCDGYPACECHALEICYEVFEASWHACNEPPWLDELIGALGWQGGTAHQAIDAVRRLVHAAKEVEQAAVLAEREACAELLDEIEKQTRLVDSWKEVFRRLDSGGLKAENERLRAALEEFAKHDWDCPKAQGWNQPCDCGLDKARRALEKGGEL